MLVLIFLTFKVVFNCVLKDQNKSNALANEKEQTIHWRNQHFNQTHVIDTKHKGVLEHVVIGLTSD